MYLHLLKYVIHVFLSRSKHVIHVFLSYSQLEMNDTTGKNNIFFTLNYKLSVIYSYM